MWKETITKEDFSSKGGAGLGLIEMARKSRMPILKKFVHQNEDTSLFFIGIEILKKDASSESNFDISTAADQYFEFIKDGVILQYNGHLTKETNAPIIEIIESNLIKHDGLDSNTAENLSVIIEVMQNTSKHGMIINHLREGIFNIHKIQDDLFISCGNYICTEKYNDFKSELEKIKLMSLEELKQERNKQMMEAALTDDGNAGLGILEIAIFTKNTFEYSFLKMPNNNYFYSIEIKLKNNG